MADSIYEFPPELTAPVLAFVAITGLDVVHNAVHKAIWSLLTTNRPADRVPIQLRVLNGDHEYSRPKPKRQSYEWYVPKGILKVNWMAKHMNTIPSLVIVFFDLDWNESTWTEKLMELCAKVQVARTALEGRSTKVAVVLIQQGSLLPPGEDMLAAERASALCAACDLPAKLLFVFPHTDHQFGYAIRLENAFYELAQAYYQQQGKLVKAHREFLNKTTHHLLFVRHQFKMGFYNELRHDIPMALKHYKQAYANLLEVRATDTNLAEVKMVAGFISYKACKLSFSRNVPLDAISQFRKHIDIFRSRTGHPDLAFEHSAWMAKQFSTFGDLFEDAIKAGLSAIQVQHPGFYYQQAAVHASARKSLCEQLCHGAPYPKSDPLADADKLEYFGQRPWRPGVQSLEPPDSRMERDGIVALQHREATEVNHSMMIIPLLSSAIAQFKKYRCPRMKRYLVVEMGEEYYSARDYGKALTLLSHVMWDYQVERWWSLLTSVVVTAVKCAYAIASVQEYVTLCLQITGQYMEVSCAEKERVQRNLVAVTSSLIPKPEPGMIEADVREAEQLWQSVMTSPRSDPLILTIDLSQVPGFVDCSASFDCTSFPVDCPVTLCVWIRLWCPLPIRFTSLSIVFSGQVYSESCVVVDKHLGADKGKSRLEDLLFEPRIVRCIPFSFHALPCDVNQDIQIVSVVLQLGDDYKRCAILHSNNLSSDQASFTTSSSESTVSIAHLSGTDSCRGLLSTKIVPRKSKLVIGVEHEVPALLNEVYPMQLAFENFENQDITNIGVAISLSEPHSNVSLSVPNLLKSEKMCPDGNRLALDRIPVGQRVERRVFVRATKEGSCTMLIKVEYVVVMHVNDEDLKIGCCCEEEVTIPIVQPFNVTSKTLSLKMERLDVVALGEMMLLQVNVESTSPFPLVLQSSRFEPHFKDSEQHVSQVQGVVVNCGDAASECRCLSVPVVEDACLPLGTYYISWKRRLASDTVPVVETAVVLPTLMTTQVPLSLSLDLPASGWVRTPLTVVYRICNRLARVQEFDFCMESSDSFMFAGHKQVHFKILPNCEMTLTYNLYPLVSGFVCLPRLKMLTHDSAYDARVESLVQSMLPSSIFIMPQAKQWLCDDRNM